MLNNIVIGKYYYGNSYVHNLNPLIKLICSILLIISTIMFENILLGLLILLFTILLNFSSDISLKYYLKNVWSIKWFLLSLLILDLIFNISFNNILRIIIIISYTSILLYTTPISQIIESLNKLLRPLKIIKVPVEKTVFLIGISISFIPRIIEQTNIILKSLKARGVNFKNSKISKKIIIIKSIIIPIFETSLKKADIMADVMEIRMYDLNRKYKKIEKKLKFNDYFQIIIHILILILVVKEGVL